MFKFFRAISFKKILLICLIFILIVIIATISCNTNIINRLTKTNSVNSIINSNVVGAEYLNKAGALLVAEQLGIAPADFLYLGDTKVDMTCACSAGMNPVEHGREDSRTR